jgi:hypothetical protein
MGYRLARHSAIAAGLGLALVLIWIFWPRHTQRLLVGVDDDTLKWTGNPFAVVRWQHELGADAVRVWVPWGGERTPRGARLDELSRAEQAARQTTVVLAIFGFAHDTPRTTAMQSHYCGYAQRVLALVPHARAVVVWNEANSPTYWSGTPAEYERLLARCYDALHRTGLTILDSTASGHAPATFLQAVAVEYERTRRNEPIVDAFGHNPYPETAFESPAATHTAGFIGEGDYARLRDALRTFGDPDVWYLEDGFQSNVPRALRTHYNGHETVTTVSPEEQAAHLQSAIALAACQPHVKAFFNFELVDEPRLAGWQSGLVWRGVHRKPAAAAFASAPRSCK